MEPRCGVLVFVENEPPFTFVMLISLSPPDPTSPVTSTFQARRSFSVVVYADEPSVKYPGLLKLVPET